MRRRIVTLGAMVALGVAAAAPNLAAQEQVQVIVTAVPNPVPAGSCTGIWVEVRNAANQRINDLNGVPLHSRSYDYSIPSTPGFNWRDNDPSSGYLCAAAGVATVNIPVTATVRATAYSGATIVTIQSGAPTQGAAASPPVGAGDPSGAAGGPAQTSYAQPAGTAAGAPQTGYTQAAGAAAGGAPQPGYAQPAGAAPGVAQPGYAQPSGGAAAGAGAQPGYGQPAGGPAGAGQTGYAQPSGGAAAGAAAQPGYGQPAGGPAGAGQTGYAQPSGGAAAGAAAQPGYGPPAGGAAGAGQTSYAQPPAAAANPYAPAQSPAPGQPYVPQASPAGAPQPTYASQPNPGAASPTQPAAAEPAAKGVGGFFKKFGKHLKQRAGEVTSQTAQNLASSANQLVDTTLQTGSGLVSGTVAGVGNTARMKVGGVGQSLIPSVLRSGTTSDNLANAVAAGRAVLRAMRFTPGTAVLEPAAQDLAVRLAGELKKSLQATPGAFLIAVHVDPILTPAGVPVPSASQGLSEQRAAALKAVLVRNGVLPAQLIALGYGASQPLPETAPDGSSSSARVEIARTQ